MIKRPMLAATAKDEAALRAHWPGTVLASPKLDGIRCLAHPELGAVSRSFKPIPNEYIRDCLDEDYHYLDGELITYTDGVRDDYNTVQSKVMSRAGDPEWQLIVFDSFRSPDAPFMERLHHAYLDSYTLENAVCLEHPHVESPDKFMELASKWLAAGQEGAMYRHPEGLYKDGRSTLRQGWLVKWKQFLDAEGTVVGYQERMHNENEKTMDAFGLIERSSHKAQMTGMGTLGALLLETSWGTLRVGTGFDDAQRQWIWDHQEMHMGLKATFKYQPYGVKDKPRFPVFLRWRMEE